MWIAGCAAMSNEPARVTLVEPETGCAEAVTATVTTLQRMGYTIDSVDRATAEHPGKVVAHRAKGWNAADPQADGEAGVSVDIRCGDAGATLDVVSGEIGMERVRFPGKFSEAFRASLANNRRPDPVAKRVEPERGLIANVRPLRSDEAKAQLGHDFGAAGLTVVQIEIDNRSPRSVRFDAGEMRLVTADGVRHSPESAEALSRRGGLGTAAKQAVIESGEIAPGTQRRGFLFFPAASYARATVIVVDLETGESDGLSIRF